MRGGPVVKNGRRLSKAMPRLARVGAHGRQAGLQAGDTAPGEAEVADPLSSTVRGRVVADDRVDGAVDDPRPQQVAVRRPRIGGQHLNSPRRRGVFGLDSQIVRTRLDRERDALGLRRAHRRQRCRRRRARCARGRPCDARRRSPGAIAARSLAAARRLEVAVGGAERAVGVQMRGVFGVHDAAVDPSSANGHARERSASRCRNSSMPLGDRKHLNPTTPASESGRSEPRFSGPRHPSTPRRCRPPARPPPAWHPAPRGSWWGQRVQRHVDDRRDPAGGRGGGPGANPPTRCGRVVEVHVRVDEPGRSTASPGTIACRAPATLSPRGR